MVQVSAYLATGCTLPGPNYISDIPILRVHCKFVDVEDSKLVSNGLFWTFLTIKYNQDKKKTYSV